MEIWGQRLMIENCIVMYFLGGGGNFSLSTSFVGCSTVYGDVVQRLMIENITIIYFSGRGGNFSLSTSFVGYSTVYGGVRPKTHN